MIDNTVIGLLAFTLSFVSPNYTANINKTNATIKQERIYYAKVDVMPKKICFKNTDVVVAAPKTIPVQPLVIEQTVVASSEAQTAPSPKALNQEQIAFLGNCESGMTPNRNSGNGFYGAFQFAPETWNNMGTGYSSADQAPLEVQIDAVERLVSQSDIYSQFPACSQMMHSQGLL